MNNVQVFDFKQNAIRATVDKDNNPLFVARDVALSLGYARPDDAVTQHCKNQVKSVVLGVSPSSHGLTCIYEPDLYRLIFGSKLESAVAFQDWVFNEVLPTIRKTGGYQSPQTEARLDRLEAEINALKNTYKPAPLLCSFNSKLEEKIISYLSKTNRPRTKTSICNNLKNRKPFIMPSASKTIREVIDHMIEHDVLTVDANNLIIIA